MDFTERQVMDKWVGILEFVKTIELGSMSKAAETLGIAKASVSKKISYLEERLGILLIHRNNNKVTPTKNGEVYFERSRQLLKSLNENDEVLLDQNNDLKGDINISLPLGLGDFFIPYMVSFKNTYPRVNFNLNFSVRRVDMISEKYDLSFRLASKLDLNVVAKKIWERPFCLCATPKYIDSHGIPQHPFELRERDCLVYSEHIDSKFEPWAFENSADKKRIVIEPRATIRSDCVNSLVSACSNHAGIIYCSQFFVSELLNKQKIHRFMDEWIAGTNTLWVIFPDRKALTKRSRAFIDHIEQSHEGLGVLN
jgi:DNA-binding transcriptional LysR family regulator